VTYDYKQLFEEMLEPAYFLDTERRIIFWNQAATRLTGFEPGEVLGTRCQDDDLEHVDDHGCNLCEGDCPMVHAMEDGEPRHAVVYLRHRDGYRVPVRIRATPLRDAGGRIVGAAEFFTDASLRTCLDLTDRFDRSVS